MQTPKELLEHLCHEADPRKVKSLRLIYEICTEQKDRGSQDYSIATIGRLSAQRGGPAPGAIRNPTGAAYRAIIQAYADSVGGNKKKQAANQGDPADQVLEGIRDPVLRARVLLLLAEIRSLRGQLNAARCVANTQAVFDMSPPAAAGQNGNARPKRKLALTEMELRTLTMAVKAQTLDHWGWKVDGAGRVVDERGQVVFGAGFTTAIQKVVEFCTEPPNIILES